MLREQTVQRDYWELILPENVRRMSPELAAVDSLLDDERFLKPFRAEFPFQTGSSDDSYRGLPAADVSEVPLQARLRSPSGGSQ